ncbi:non-LTR retroelement reverse transcriptase-like protein [Gossypium australe]|uniref:Non-LTR retroelement reverse transcriptase-like protein n=1 Tax=Gossypium australe TaxID=47621 RepID=A0A5B6WP28_9ROSI|nr:non-LTR retroelement reverse transcriptase-like protein [Gossypium australe]
MLNNIFSKKIVLSLKLLLLSIMEDTWAYRHLLGIIRSIWKHMFLPTVGKEVILVYNMSVLLLPHNSCDNLQKMMNSFWWNPDGDRQKIHWVSWDFLCVPKSTVEWGSTTFTALI